MSPFTSVIDPEMPLTVALQKARLLRSKRDDDG